MRVDDVMVPRADIEAVEIDATLGELLVDRSSKSGHSRMPVFRETLDDPVGLVHIKDLMARIADAAGRSAAGDGRTATASRATPTRPPSSTSPASTSARRSPSAGLVRNILFVPPSMPVATLLANMQAARMQMALVIDEYGGTDGLVSLEDALEMVVGEIEDEHDDEAGPMIVPDKDGGFLADARADLEEVAEVDRHRFRRRRARRGRRHHRRPGLRAGRPHSGARRAGRGAGRLRVRDPRRRSAPHQAAAASRKRLGRSARAAPPPPPPPTAARRQPASAGTAGSAASLA